jgi:lipopolysaccharide transport system permease protein
MSDTATAAVPPLTGDEGWTIEPRATGFVPRLFELWRYRRMFRFFAHRAVLKLYRKTMLGAVWIVLRPLIPLTVRVVLFGALLEAGDSKVPYFLFVAVGTAAWELFGNCVMWATRSLELNGGMLTKVYVPRLILPMVTMTPGLVQFGINVAVIVFAIFYYRVHNGVWYLDPTWLVVAPVSIVLILLLALSIGLWTSVLAIGARDVRFGLGYVLDFWIYLTPVVYPVGFVKDHVQWVMMLNPMAVLVVAFRGAILGGEGPTPVDWLMTLSTIGVLLALGWRFFQRAEAAAVDNL